MGDSARNHECGRSNAACGLHITERPEGDEIRASDERTKSFETRLLQLKKQMKAGLHRRARELRAAAGELDRGDAAARTSIKSQAHRIRGIAGTYGYGQLSELAGQVERNVSLAPKAHIIDLTVQLAQLAEVTGISQRPPRSSEPNPL